jgi:hypothetical protein
MAATEKKWTEMSPDERMDHRFQAWLNPGVPFSSPEAEHAYKARVTRLTDAMRLKKRPDRVPVFTTMGTYPAAKAGLTPYEAMTETARAGEAWYDFNLEFQPDAMVTPLLYTMSATAFETLDYRLYNLPSKTAGIGSTGYQFNEGEYMFADEYDALIADPTDFVFRTILPRVVGAYAGIGKLVSPWDLTILSFSPLQIMSWGLPEVRASLEKMMTAGEQMLDWAQNMGASVGRIMAAGFPANVSGLTEAPFDHIGDNLRGTRGILTDLYRRPEKVLEACDRLAPVIVNAVVQKSTPDSIPGVFIPLHKGADGFMSLEQFETFYWPSLRKVILGLIDHGFVPWLFAEGRYSSRLKTISDLPKGKTVWWFDQTDMAKAKETLGDVACIQGNVPLSLIHAGTPEQVSNCCRDLLGIAGKGGGFILDLGAGPDWAQAENIHAVVRAAKEYGAY